MRQKQIAIAALACGIVCALCVVIFMASVQGKAEAARAETLARYGGEQVEACVAVRAIAAGERIDANAVATKMWVADLLPEGAYGNASEVVGRTATSPILKGEVIAAGRFSATSEGIEVPADKTAVSLPTKTVRAVGGALSPGMHVDVYSSGDSATVLLASNVLVLATSSGESGASTSGDLSWITLAVDAERVQEFVSASERTNLYFALPGADVTAGEMPPMQEGAEADASVDIASSAAVAQPESEPVTASEKEPEEELE